MVCKRWENVLYSLAECDPSTNGLSVHSSASQIPKSFSLLNDAQSLPFNVLITIVSRKCVNEKQQSNYMMMCEICSAFTLFVRLIDYT